MTVPHDFTLPSSLRTRIETIAAKSGQSPAAVIADALENGHSLDWQEQFVDHVLAGIADADRGNFASAEDIDRVLNRYRPS
ncbi:transcriptional regulator [Tianweitania sp.]|uniref:transcriptional regulator n=1 Tax=Tianweitania sp. TaxID=2021634 RepID=UPI00289E28EF|nr:transcriptional regulator [Tianweitania sp.]